MEIVFWGKTANIFNQTQGTQKTGTPTKESNHCIPTGYPKTACLGTVTALQWSKRDFILQGISEGFHIICDKSLTKFSPVEMKIIDL